MVGIHSGGAILLVVLGHLTLINGVGVYSEIIYLFHMPLFFAISGFLYGYKELKSIRKPQDLIRKKNFQHDKYPFPLRGQ